MVNRGGARDGIGAVECWRLVGIRSAYQASFQCEYLCFHQMNLSSSGKDNIMYSFFHRM